MLRASVLSRARFVVLRTHAALGADFAAPNPQKLPSPCPQFAAQHC
jgi:hypothetical protein